MSGQIWAVVQQKDGRLQRAGRETVAAAQALARELGTTAVAVVLGDGVAGAGAELAGMALAGVRVVEHPRLGAYTPGGYLAALAPLIRAGAPAYVLFAHTYQTVDFLPRLAQELDAGFLPEALGFQKVDGELRWTRPVLGGKLHAQVRTLGAGTVLVSLQSGAFPADAVQAGTAPVEQVAAALDGVDLQREVLGIESAGEGTVDLTKAEVIVGVGRGIGGQEKLGPVEELTRLLGAELAASRPVVDSGWLPRERQVGSSGQTVAPKLYLALGISGAIQHLVGMKGSGMVIAVNKDASAPIFKIATYGVVGDLHEVVPALNQALQQRAAG
ncbi:MAG TPA: electron transfer flavoprotein subunit alpha/FixB family protein [Thermoanaerobaculia bacterium]|jgi:electron transfer flavoprotein alpha subunit|nr:electron transfer flavoprotein subunit alpha/FixB family protein [Thermoanaerobaculia bacterium]MBP7814117.1 electron transfer flavoprotein subunit alpha/FixB family protein [Thermoanaerobaculia bacterium]MBP8844715.1 electron transfer flavoprotein subunit alpha/FixB family protein [Thermoanaerobaculia bacterium]HPA96121.1 electron transfer flavoprotein subunit alpha/FixB family protein [Thermoanaerobaculia bacterium]HQN38455.1 electron transfer flavoprotein subunit alpha/FixB family protein